jgi:hypothetical protein
MANIQVSGRIGDAIKETYQHLKVGINASFPGTSLSVGARLQANNDDEIIITHTNSVINIMKGAAPRHDHDLNIICFSKSYVSACAMADKVFEDFSVGSTVEVQGDSLVQGVFNPKSQIMYYTDEDDYAVSVNVTLTIIDKTNI